MIFKDLKEQMMITQEQITDWFCERNKIKIEELDKYHRYAIATVFKYAQEQVKNLTIPDVVGRSEQLVCDCPIPNTTIELPHRCIKCDKPIKWE